ncbi:hypothetical protein B0I08_101346 [Glaciihabitans tibetensis]|uniref:Tic20 family protein n=1 Tax=Glaciihabitans tibetensis TaxID=1266600 RepID=A0A2T0VJ20_9MICO|nr:DUF4870 domain-containing protein [Glaciihabitans tibetensis]PRY70218.1 hypothetical protein B0I08_101346 [Glaciihabitans tibetensis]
MSQTPPPQNPYQSAAQLSPSDEKLWATLVHILGIFFSFIPALVGYLLLKDRGPFVRQHTTAALNFQLTMLIAYVIGIVTSVILIGVFILLAVVVVELVFSIIAAVAANNGQTYKYPLTIEFIK